jgi:transposase
MLRELNVVEQRYRAVLEVLSGNAVVEVAERYGVVRQTVHRWVVRYRAEGLDGLADRSHAPRQHLWRIAAETEALICELRRAHRRWGPRRLVFEMGRRGYPGLSRSTVYRVLVRHQLIQPVPRRRRRDQFIRVGASGADAAGDDDGGQDDEASALLPVGCPRSRRQTVPPPARPSGTASQELAGPFSPRRTCSRRAKITV